MTEALAEGDDNTKAPTAQSIFEVEKALRICTSKRTLSQCSKVCPYYNTSDCRTTLMLEAADSIKQMSTALKTLTDLIKGESVQ